MATNKVDITGTNAISASQMGEFFRLAAKPGSHVNRETLQTYLEWKPLFLEPGTGEFLRLARIIEEMRLEAGISDETFRTLWLPEGRPHLEKMIAGLKKVDGEALANTVIRVDRAIKPIYPDWMKEVIHPKLEATGPAEYDLAHVKPWLHESQKDGRTIEGHKLYEHLKQNSMLESCLSLRDGEEIQKRGVEAFRKYFGGKAVFLWKSVVRGRGGDLNVPCLVEFDGQVVLSWGWLDDAWDGSDPAARLAS